MGVSTSTSAAPAPSLLSGTPALAEVRSTSAGFEAPSWVAVLDESVASIGSKEDAAATGGGGGGELVVPGKRAGVMGREARCAGETGSVTTPSSAAESALAALIASVGSDTCWAGDGGGTTVSGPAEAVASVEDQDSTL